MGTKTTGIILDRLLEEARKRGSFESEVIQRRLQNDGQGYELAKTQELLKHAQNELALLKSRQGAAETFFRELHLAGTSMVAKTSTSARNRRKAGRELMEARAWLMT